MLEAVDQLDQALSVRLSRRIAHEASSQRRTLGAAFWPPKPKALISAVRISRDRGFTGVQSRSAIAGEGSMRFRVGGTQPSRSAQMAAIAPMPPAAPSVWPMALLVAVIEILDAC